MNGTKEGPGRQNPKRSRKREAETEKRPTLVQGNNNKKETITHHMLVNIIGKWSHLRHTHQQYSGKERERRNIINKKSRRDEEGRGARCVQAKKWFKVVTGTTPTRKKRHECQYRKRGSRKGRGKGEEGGEGRRFYTQITITLLTESLLQQ